MRDGWCCGCCDCHSMSTIDWKVLHQHKRGDALGKLRICGNGVGLFPFAPWSEIRSSLCSQMILDVCSIADRVLFTHRWELKAHLLCTLPNLQRGSTISGRFLICDSGAKVLWRIHGAWSWDVWPITRQSSGFCCSQKVFCRTFATDKQPPDTLLGLLFRQLLAKNWNPVTS